MDPNGRYKRAIYAEMQMSKFGRMRSSITHRVKVSVSGLKQREFFSNLTGFTGGSKIFIKC